MRIGGLVKLSLVDYPEKVAAVIFTQGCNFRCPYCHNRALVLPQCFQPPLKQEEVLSYLQLRRAQLQGVVITGGEPTVQKDLLEFLRIIKNYGYAVKLDTNGSQPQILQQAISEHLVDFIAMDIKAPWSNYDRLAGVAVDQRALSESIQIILNAAQAKTGNNPVIGYQFRTTFVKSLHSLDDLALIRTMIPGAENYKIQNFVGCDSVLNPDLLKEVEFL